MPCVLRDVEIAAGDELAPLGEPGTRAPRLLPVDHPGVTVALGASCQRAEVGPGPRLGEQLAAQRFGPQQAREQPGAQLRLAELGERRGDEMERHAERLVVGRVHVAGLELVEGGRELLGQSGAAELGRPRQGAVTGVELLALPRHRAVEQCALLVVGEIVEHLDVVAADAPCSRQLSGAGRQRSVVRRARRARRRARSTNASRSIRRTTLHNCHDESNLTRRTD